MQHVLGHHRTQIPKLLYYCRESSISEQHQSQTDLLKGPGSTWSNGSLIPGIETSIEYILKLVKKIQSEGVLSITVSQEATDDLYQHFDEFHKQTVWQEECRSWFKNGRIKNRIYLWPGPVSSRSISCQQLTFSDYPLLENHQGTKTRRL
jgi:hypothetical protein